MRFFIAALGAAALFGCSPVLSVVRWERPKAELRPEQLPLRITLERSDSVLLNVLSLFVDSSGDVQAALRLQAALARAGVPQTDPGDARAPTTFTARLSSMEFDVVSGRRRARAQITLGAFGETLLLRGDASAEGAEPDQQLALRAIDAAAESFADRFRGHEVIDSFALSKRTDLAAGHELLFEGKLDEAIAFFREVIQRAGDDLDALGSLVAALTAAGQLEEAARMAHRRADATTDSLRLNRAFEAQDADRRVGATDRVERFSVSK